MRAISRRRRAEIQRRAAHVRSHGQREQWSVARIVAAIHDEIRDVHSLEAWRLAYGWTRPQALAQLAELYHRDGLHPPLANTQMLTRWEHGTRAVSPEYAVMLCRLYRANPRELGLDTPRPTTPQAIMIGATDWYGSPTRNGHYDQHHHGLGDTPNSGGDGHLAMTGGDQHAPGALSAVRESLQLILDTEGPTGGQLAHDHLDGAIEHYALNYSAYPPAVLFREVQLCRALVARMMPAQPDPQRQHLRMVIGWLSGLMGNLAFHQSDYAGATTHLAAAAQLGIDTHDDRLTAWARGAQSMVARYQGRFIDALTYAEDGYRYARTPITRAQLLAWAQLPALAGLQRHTDADSVLGQARHELDRDPHGETPGRFGFDRAELTLHAADAYITLGRPDQARTYAQTSIDHKRPDTPGWAAATITLAQAEFTQRPDHTAELSHHVLDRIPPNQLRDTTRRRLAVADALLRSINHPRSDELHERLLTLPAL